MKTLHWKHLITNFTRFTPILKHHFDNTTSEYRYLQSQNKLNIFNLQEWHHNTWNCKSLFQRLFIVYKTFTVGIKTKNLPWMTRFGLWSFYTGVFIRRPTIQEDHFWLAPRVIVLYRFDCTLILLKLSIFRKNIKDIKDKSITRNIFRIQDDFIICGFYCIAFVEYIIVQYMTIVFS